jgi:hypothetical protein
MPGFSYGISAKKCHTGSQLRKVPGSVCSGCYACTDWYFSWGPLIYGHQRRFDSLQHPRWVDAMAKLIGTKCRGEGVFRWHDSGDLQGAWHLANIAEVCRRTPAVSHWLPTREYSYVVEYLKTDTIPDNLCVRLSAHMIDSEPALPPDLVGFPTSTVSTAPMAVMGMKLVDGKGSIECRAVEVRDNKCGACRACWDRRVSNVQYPQH